MKKEYAKLEQHIIKLFKKEIDFDFKGKTYKTMIVGKPRPNGKSGECKTDVYIQGKSKNKVLEIKLSVKMKDKNEWQESKVSKDRAEAIFGNNWSSIIETSTSKIKHKFEDLSLLFASRKGTTKENSATMGWRLEITNKERNLSVPIQLTDQEIRNSIYKGINLPECKRNAVINGVTINNCGVADYIIYTTIDDLSSIDDVLNQMQSIDTMKVPTTYLTFIANNYRTKEKKIDGSRPLAVYVNWDFVDGKIHRKIITKDPLLAKGRELVVPFLKKLEQLKKNHPCELEEKDLGSKKLLHK